jgi:hypothetical protein
MRYAISALVLLGLAGCGVELLTTTAIQGELQAEQLKAMDRQLKGAADSTAQINIQRAIDTYRAEKGANPPSLEALVPAYLPQLPVRPDGLAYGYDPVSGQLTGQGVPVPGALGGAAGGALGATEPDRLKIQEIKQAITRYGMATGYYPPTLQALVPAYLPALPKTTSGHDFAYNNQNGEVWHPAQTQAQPQQVYAPRPQTGVGGAGPMGEVMTGIGIQNQLNSMSNSGSSAAGSRMREGAGQVQDDYSARQQRALEQLGY